MDIKNLAITGGILFAVYKFSGNKFIMGAAASVGAVIVAKQIPFVKDALK